VLVPTEPGYPAGERCNGWKLKDLRRRTRVSADDQSDAGLQHLSGRLGIGRGEVDAGLAAAERFVWSDVRERIGPCGTSVYWALPFAGGIIRATHCRAIYQRSGRS
jgi:hypothetical protein